MFEKERAEIMVLSNIASAQGLTYVSDLLRTAQSEWAKAEEYRAKLQPQVNRLLKTTDWQTMIDAADAREINNPKRLPDIGDE